MVISTSLAVRTDSDVTFHNIAGTGSLQWFTFHYTVSNPEGKVSVADSYNMFTKHSTAGEAHIFINDNPVPMNISDHNSRAGYHKAIPIQLILNPGSVNTVRFGASGSQGKIETHN